MADKIIRVAQVQPGTSARGPTPADDPFALVIVGARGNLATLKLFPALYRLWQNGFFAAPWIIVGLGRAPQTDEQFRKATWDNIRDKLPSGAADRWRDFAASLYYQAV